MKYNFLYNPGNDDLSGMADFYNSLQSVAIEQHSKWSQSVEPWKRLCYFIASDNDKVVCTAVIEEIRKPLISQANIQFGPLFLDADVAAKSLEQIYSYYKKAGFTLLTIQPGIPTGAFADYFELQVNKRLPVKYFFDRNNWSSISIDLSTPEDELLRNMSKGHRSDIKKALKSGLNILNEFSDGEFEQFVQIYTKMHKERGLPESPGGSASFLRALKKNFSEFHSGRFMLVANTEKQILGGIVLLFHGKTVRYYKGAADPEIRNLPVLHLAIWSAITDSAAKGFEHFDLWGYNHYVTESDQLFFINRFKKGFGGSFTFYPKKMYCVLRPVKYKTLNRIQKVYRKIFKS